MLTLAAVLRWVAARCSPPTSQACCRPSSIVWGFQWRTRSLREASRRIGRSSHTRRRGRCWRMVVGRTRCGQPEVVRQRRRGCTAAAWSRHNRTSLQQLARWPEAAHAMATRRHAVALSGQRCCCCCSWSRSHGCGPCAGSRAGGRWLAGARALLTRRASRCPTRSRQA